MKDSTIRKILFWCLISECSIVLFLQIENYVFNLTILLINVIVSLLLALQKTPIKEMKEYVEKITRTKYPQTVEELREALNAPRPTPTTPLKVKFISVNEKEEKGLINNILKALGIKE